MDKIKFNVSMELTKAQALAMKAFFEEWNECAIMGRSRRLAFFVDGDGDFKPNCQIDCPDLDVELTDKLRELASGNYNNVLVFDYDNIAWALGQKTESSKQPEEKTTNSVSLTNLPTDKIFVKQLESDIFLAYQQMNTKLRATVRSKSGVVGALTTFQKISRGTASTESHQGIVPVTNLNHESVECMLRDYYAGDWVETLEELKTNIDERRVVASACAYALGRKTDELIVSAMNNATISVGDYSTGLTKDLILSAIEQLNVNNVPDDGRRFAVIGVQQWNQLLGIEKFFSADCGNGVTNKWLGITWLLHNGLPSSGTQRDCFIYHASCIGHAYGQEVETDISWHGERAAHFVSNCLPQGAVLIDNTGVVRVKCKDVVTSDV